ncbi:hypothetical protein Tco_0727659 [Tanacetum coccineum]|uniref:Uncharacterized protein n=1 Tax=Tanacetum coccineum TaxID=301880 RepID=A0ABQ4YLZ4_9ASTR
MAGPLDCLSFRRSVRGGGVEQQAFQISVRFWNSWFFQRRMIVGYFSLSSSVRSVGGVCLQIQLVQKVLFWRSPLLARGFSDEEDVLSFGYFDVLYLRRFFASCLPLVGDQISAFGVRIQMGQKWFLSSSLKWTTLTLQWKNTSGLRKKRSVETEFPAIDFNDGLTLSYEPTTSSPNDDEIDFGISNDESDDDDYTIIFDKNLFSYKIISANDLKMDSENDNEKVNMPLFPSPEPMVNFLTEPTVSPQHIDEFNLKDETSLSECDEEEHNILNFNDLFHFNVIYPNDSKSDKDNDDDNFDIKHSSGDLSVNPLPDVIITDVGAYPHGSKNLLETRPRERNIDEYWWRIYKSGDLEMLES